MANVETEALILRTYPLSDADKIVVALTLDDGLVRGVAKGAKRLKSRFGSGLEPFTVVKLAYFRKEERELVSITEAELVRSYFAIASDPNFLTTFSQAAELLQDFAPPHDPNERLFKMTKVCLEAAADDRDRLVPVFAYFRVWLLKLGGFLPQWEKCSSCAREIGLRESCTLQADLALVCTDCKGRGTVQQIDPGQREIFLYAQRTSPEKFSEFAQKSPESLEAVSAVLGRMISRILNREVTSFQTTTGAGK